MCTFQTAYSPIDASGQSCHKATAKQWRSAQRGATESLRENLAKPAKLRSKISSSKATVGPTIAAFMRKGAVRNATKKLALRSKQLLPTENAPYTRRYSVSEGSQELQA